MLNLARLSNPNNLTLLRLNIPNNLNFHLSLQYLLPKEHLMLYYMNCKFRPRYFFLEILNRVTSALLVVTRAEKSV
jgi:hypothetical protein